MENLIREINDSLKEINDLLAARSRELDRRAKFDKEISEEIQKLLKRSNEYKHRHTRTEPDDS